MFGDQPVEEVAVVWEAAVVVVVVAGPEVVEVADGVSVDEGAVVVAVGGAATSPPSPSSLLRPPRLQPSADLPSPLGPSSFGPKPSHRLGRTFLPGC